MTNKNNVDYVLAVRGESPARSPARYSIGTREGVLRMIKDVLEKVIDEMVSKGNPLA